MRITITDPLIDDGTFILFFYAPNLSIWESEEFSANPSASELRKAIEGFYKDHFGSKISVVRQMYDVNDVLTINEADTVKNVYTITVLRLINTVTLTSTPGLTKRTAASISFELPDMIPATSTAPLSGSFRIIVKDSTGASFSTEDLPLDCEAWEIR